MRTCYLIGALILVTLGCAEKKPDQAMKESNKVTPPTAETEPSAAEPAPAPAADQTLTLTGLRLTLKAPGCVIVKADEEQRAMLAPSDPDCRVLPLMGVELRDATIDFAEDKAVHAAETLLGGSEVSQSKTDDGYRVEFATRSGRGLIIARTFGDRTINCRGTGRSEQIEVIEAICASLTAN